MAASPMSYGSIMSGESEVEQMAEVQAGQKVQVNVAGLLDLGDRAETAVSASATVVAVHPVTKIVTVVLDTPIGGQHTVTADPSRVRPAN